MANQFPERVALITTVRTKLVAWVTSDLITERTFNAMNPELAELDPPVGKCENPLIYSILLLENDKHIGMCCLYNLESNKELEYGMPVVKQRVEYGIRIFDSNYWNAGYGREITNAMCVFAFSTNGHLKEVYLKTPLSNKRAQACYYKCGFTAYDSGFVDGISMIFMRRPRDK